ncbi:DUF6193 family natural product biosynthesis protein [Nocardia sp. NPDC004711]
MTSKSGRFWHFSKHHDKLALTYRASIVLALVGETAAEAVALIASHLPAGCGPAIDGTAEDLP